jgi:hypothetical protein
MVTSVQRRTVDLAAFPDLVVIYLGMRVNRLAGLKTLLGFGPKISASAAARPDGLLQHENVIYSPLSHAHRDAPVLARYGFPDDVDALGPRIANGGRTS